MNFDGRKRRREVVEGKAERATMKNSNMESSERGREVINRLIESVSQNERGMRKERDGNGGWRGKEEGREEGGGRRIMLAVQKG